VATIRRSTSVFVLVLLSILGPALAGVGASAHAAKPRGGADMSVSPGSSTAYPDQIVALVVGVGNRGPMPATGVELTVQLPDSVRFEPARSDTHCAESAGAVSCQFPFWEVNAAGLVLIAMTPSTTGSFPLTFTVTAAEPDPDPSNNSRTVVLEVLEPVADVYSSIERSTQGYAGQPLFLFVGAGNNGPSTATGLTVTVDFPAGLSPVDQTGCTATSPGLTCSYPFGDLPPQRGAIAPLQLDPAAAGSYTVLTRVTAAQPDPDLSNNSGVGAVEITPAADLSVQVADSADPATPGQPLTYTVTVTNAGPSPASAVALVDTWTSTTRRLELASVTSSQGQCTATASMRIDCQLGTIDSGGSVSVAVTVRPVGTGTITDETQASAAEFEPNTADNAASETTAVGH
jgi:uncharacterized repeat protein (TIGR01451 family)